MTHRARSSRTRSVEQVWGQTSLEGSQVERPNANCPILAGMSRLTGLTEDIQRTMRRLRGDLDRCKTCTAGQHCPVLQDYQAQITEAIATVLDEFQHTYSSIQQVEPQRFAAQTFAPQNLAPQNPAPKARV